MWGVVFTSRHRALYHILQFVCNCVRIFVTSDVRAWLGPQSFPANEQSGDTREEKDVLHRCRQTHTIVAE
jgi:hypothetical protein